MAIETLERQGGTGDDVRLVACPACGADRDDWERGAFPFHVQNCPKRGEL